MPIDTNSIFISVNLLQAIVFILVNNQNPSEFSSRRIKLEKKKLFRNFIYSSNVYKVEKYRKNNCVYSDKLHNVY